MKKKWSIVRSSCHKFFSLWLIAVCIGMLSSPMLGNGQASAYPSIQPDSVFSPAVQSTGIGEMRQMPIVEVEVDVRDEHDVAVLQSMGYSCAVGVCKLELNEGEELVLIQLGLSVRITARAIKVSGEAGSFRSIDATQGEYFVFGGNYTDIPIPDFQLGSRVCSLEWSDFDVSSAPAGATVTKFYYTARIAHQHVGDLIVSVGRYPYTKIWDRWGHENDGGLDDDTEIDADIELINRETTAFNGELVNGHWALSAEDCEWWNTGNFDYWYLKLYYWVCESADLPSTPSGPSPSNSATGVYRDQDLNWDDAARATSYDLFFGTTNPPRLQGNTTPSSFELAPLASSSHYYWKVVAKNACGSTTGPTWDFTTGCWAPDTPSWVFPANSATGVSIDADLDWNDVPDTTSYDVFFGTTDPPRLQGSTTSSSFPLVTLSFNTHYYWKVAAKNACGSTSGPTWDFTTGCWAPDTPSWVFPANSATGVPTDADLDWNDVPGATSYDVFFGTTDPPRLQGSTTSSNLSLETLSFNTHYYWKVVAKNECGTTNGPVWDFTTQVDTRLKIFLPLIIHRE